MAKKYDYLTKETAYPMIARFLKSGGLPSDFYKKEGLSESQFYTWRKRYLQDHPGVSTQSTSSIKEAKEPQASFHPIQVSPSIKESTREKDYQFELKYPNGIVLRIDGSLNEAQLTSLIKLY
jgi:hypothetical protein